MKKIINHLKENWIKYGFETLVVTIGILGAFTLNNWREQNGSEKKLIKLFEDVKDELAYDLLELHPRIDNNERLITESDQIIDHEFDWNQRPESIKDFANYSILLSNNSYNGLLNFADQVPEEYDSIMLLLNQVYGRWSIRIQYAQEDFLYLRNKYHDQVKGYQWYDSITSDLPIGEDAITFYNSNTDFRNTYKFYNRNLIVQNNNLKSVYVRNIELLFRIKEFLKDTTGLPDFIPSNDYVLSSVEKNEIAGAYMLEGSSIVDKMYFRNDYLVDISGSEPYYYKSIAKDLFMDIIRPEDTIKIVRQPTGEVDGFRYNEYFYRKLSQD